MPYPSSAFVPVEGLPSFLRGLAEHQPVTLAIEALRELTSGAPVGDQATVLALWPGGSPWPPWR
ncbi:ABC transporter permease [Nocardiopsis valliformis]|uniref:ABC transporter permease n=1 Tax=Nocardiopsis valliformis TaxID=239974 RepID=UPI00034B63D4|nr:ABC transporter permease [Nocardiopsis valliformis]